MLPYGQPSMQTIGEAFVWPSRDREWFGKVLLMGLIGLIPIIGGINGLGWTLATVDNLRRGDHRLPPAGFNYLERGFRPFVVFLVYWLAILAVLGGVVAIFASGFFATGTSRNPRSPLVGALAAFVNLGLFGIQILLSAGVALAFTPILLLTDYGGIRNGLNVPRLIEMMGANAGSTLLAGLMMYAASLVASLGIVLCCVGIIFTAAYGWAMQAWVVRSYEVSLRPRSPTPTAPPG